LEYYSKIAGHFGREQTLQLMMKNFHWTNIECDIRKYCNEYDICHRTKARRHAKHCLLNPLELACKPWTPINAEFFTDLPKSEGATIILGMVDRFPKMAHFVLNKKKD